MVKLYHKVRDKRKILAMGFGEKILHKVAEAFSHQTSEQHAPNDAVFVATPVNPEDILKRGHWKNNRGATLRINVERGVMYDYASKEESLVDLVDTESIRKKLTEGGYVFVPATAEVLPETQEKSVPEVLEQPLPEITEKERGVVVQDDEALEQLLEGLDARVELIKTALDEAQEIVDAGHFQPMQSIIDEIASRVTVAVETANSLSRADDTANELAAQEGKLDKSYATAKQARLEKLKALSEEIALLEEHASMAIKSLKKLHGQAVDGALNDTVMSARGKNSDAEGGFARNKKKKGAKSPRGGGKKGKGGDGTVEDDEALADEESTHMGAGDTSAEPDAESGEPASQQSEGEGSGPGGPEGPEDFGVVLERLRVRVTELITAIKTPEEYATFRSGMVLVPAKEAGRSPRRHFFAVDDIKDQVGRRLEDDEFSQLNVLERELEQATRQKFFDLINADLDAQYSREQVKVLATQDEVTLDTMAAAWDQESPVVSLWKEAFSGLTEKEQQIVTGEYQGCLDRLRDNLEARRNELVLQAFAERSGGNEKLEFLRGIIQKGYDVYRKHINQMVGGRMSNREREELWRAKDGERILREAIVKHLQESSGLKSEEAEKIFNALTKELQEKR